MLLSEFDASAYPAGTFSPDVHWYDPFVVLAAIAGATTSIRLGTGSRSFPTARRSSRPGGGLAGLQERREVLLRRRSRLDARGVRRPGGPVLRAGSTDRRVPCGHEAAVVRQRRGVPRRVRRLPRGTHQSPTADRPHPPILVGGETPAALRRIARHGDGFCINWKSLTEFRRFLIRWRRAWQRTAGRSRTCTCSWPAPIPTSCGRSATTSGRTRTWDSPRSPSCRRRLPAEGFALMHELADEFISIASKAGGPPTMRTTVISPLSVSHVGLLTAEIESCVERWERCSTPPGLKSARRGTRRTRGSGDLPAFGTGRSSRCSRCGTEQSRPMPWPPVGRRSPVGAGRGHPWGGTRAAQARRWVRLRKPVDGDAAPRLARRVLDARGRDRAHRRRRGRAFRPAQ